MNSQSSRDIVRLTFANETWYMALAIAAFAYIGPPRAAQAQSNDLCTNATVIETVPFIGQGFVLFGTGSDQVPTPCAPSCCDVWWQITPGTGGVLAVDTCGSSFDTVVSVYTGACGSLTQIACNDNCGGAPCGSPMSCLTAAVSPNVNYHIRVARFGQPPGTFGLVLLHVDVIPPLPGACCLPGGGCVTLTSGQCETTGGAYAGDNTACSSNTCAPTTALVDILSANPPLAPGNPYVPGQPFRDVLQNRDSLGLPQGIGAAGTAPACSVSYSPIMVTFSGTPSPHPEPTNIVLACTDVTGNGKQDCPTVTSVSGSGAGPYAIGLSGVIPARECTSFVFAGTNPGQVLQYQSLPGDVNLDSASNTQDLLGLVQALNNGMANMCGNLARYNVDRAGSVNTQDLLRLVQLLNGSAGATQAFNGATVAPCAPQTALDCPEPGNKSRPLACPATGKCGECGGHGGEGIGDPVLGYSGEFVHSETDLRIKGRGLDFTWARKYRHRIGPNTVMGNRWDFSYNIRIAQAGNNIVRYDGNTRGDVYRADGTDRWTRAEFFDELTRDAGTGVYTLTFPDTSRWVFRPLDGSPAQGKIDKIIDRNGNDNNPAHGNRLTFAYDGAGRLITITDTLGRNISVTYIAVPGAGERIDSVTDFAGRQVKYEYYASGEPGGSAGDLKSARSPIVTGTPNSNDFPLGKKTVYTYTTGFSDERLNHCLKTIRDPRNNVYLTNFYAHTIAASDSRFTTNPANLNFNRV
ncbi:MAG TPA: DUF6531 domain-containing protein, partial [Phycisphaerae bacterium]